MKRYTRAHTLALLSTGDVDSVTLHESDDGNGFLMIVKTPEFEEPLQSRGGTRVFKTADAAVNFARGMGINPVVFVFNGSSKRKRRAQVAA